MSPCAACTLICAAFSYLGRVFILFCCRYCRRRCCCCCRHIIIQYAGMNMIFLFFLADVVCLLCRFRIHIHIFHSLVIVFFVFFSASLAVVCIYFWMHKISKHYQITESSVHIFIVITVTLYSLSPALSACTAYELWVLWAAFCTCSGETLSIMNSTVEISRWRQRLQHNEME